MPKSTVCKAILKFKYYLRSHVGWKSFQEIIAIPDRVLAGTLAHLGIRHFSKKDVVAYLRYPGIYRLAVRNGNPHADPAASSHGIPYKIS